MYVYPKLFPVLLFALATPVAPVFGADSVNFNRDIRPILSDRCFQCHGPDEADREEDLRLDLAGGPQGALTPREDYFIIKPGSPDESELWWRVTEEWEEDRMPPPEAHKKPLDDKELALIKRWIEEGAEYQNFWAFVPPKPSAPPATPASDRAANYIDHHVLARLKEEGLEPNPEANKRTLIRRLSFDLTGLPPSLEEIDTFLSDKEPGAYERLVDRLLDKPAYGEHMTRYWADLVRLADTNGMHKDFHREFSPYRDWLIRAFNDNLAFDAFLKYQLAGDLYEEPTIDQLVASGFNRLHMIIDKGTALPEESLHKNILDRVEAFGTAFLGLTVQCAQCHDHKYDPITQKDYYQLYAFFNNFSGAAETVNRPERGLQPPFINLTTPRQERELANFDANIRRLEYELDMLDRRTQLGEKWPGYDKQVSVPWIWAKPERESKSLKLVRHFNLPAVPDMAMLRYTGQGQAETRINGVVQGRAEGPEKSVIAEVTSVLKAGENVIAATASGKAGFALILEYRIGEETFAIRSDESWSVKIPSAKAWGEAHVLQDLKDQDGWTTRARIPEALDLIARREETEKERKAYLETVPGAMIMSEMDPPRQAYFLHGGAYDNPGEPVGRNTPDFLPALPQKEGRYTRMDLAEWLVTPGHPLTARVAVNRFWQQFFGVGLVKTSEDFGAQGEWPSHPELLDDLAVRFMKSGWNVKQLLRNIVLSRTYRQSSDASSEAFEADPQNRLLARGSRYRMDAEMLRDQILAVSGLLNPKLYGESVKPPQPPGLWEMVSMAAPFTYVADTGDKIYRRSLYTYWRRGMPPPQMTILNAPSREYCVARRERTNTPLQALLLMNEPEYFKAARVTAENTLAACSDSRAGLEMTYEKITSHLPDNDRMELMEETLADFRNHYRKNPELTQSLTPEMPDRSMEERIEVAAWTLLTHSLLNLELAKVRR